MSTPTPNGGPAFPYAFQHEESAQFTSGGFAPGMTLRDWFAGQALQGLCACQNVDCDSSDLARWSYKEADAMLAARERKGTT